jgi:hypothetical protein
VRLTLSSLTVRRSRKNKDKYYSCHHNLDSRSESCGNRSVRQNEFYEYTWNWIISILNNPPLIAQEIGRRSEEDPDRKRINERKMDLKRIHIRLINARNKLLGAYTEEECLSLDELKTDDYAKSADTANVKQTLFWVFHLFQLTLFKSAEETLLG